MAIVKLEPDSGAINNTQSIPSALSEPNTSVFTTLFPEGVADSLLKYVEGYPWSCHFYGQMVTQVNSLEHFDPTSPNLTQPLYEVKDLILQVNSPLNTSYEASTGVTSSSGSATAPLGLKPNVGDLFIAQVDTGEDAIFCITTVERKTYRKSTLYDINYSLYAYTSEQRDFVQSLQARIQQTFFFNKDTNYFNRDALITPSVKEATDRLKAFMRESQEYYLQSFADSASGTIVLPGVSHSLYDPLLLGFLGTFIDHDIKISHPWFQYTWQDRYLLQKSFFDLLLTRNPNMVGVVNRTYSFTPSTQLTGLARMGNISHVGVDYVLYPTQPHTHTDVERLHRISASESFTQEHLGSRAYFDCEIMVRSANNPQGQSVVLLPKLFESDVYVVSSAFYDALKDDSAQALSFAEVLAARFIRRQAIAREDLLLAVESFYAWSPLHQLYWLPVLWLIIRATL